MELKYIQDGVGGMTYVCSNRTFMELKLRIATAQRPRGWVLIVPLWN